MTRRALGRAWGFGRGNRALRAAVLLVYAYLALVLVVNGVIVSGVAVARVAGQDPRADLVSLPDVKHLRQVDASLWAGAAPSRADYEDFAAMGVSTVVDLQEQIAGDDAGAPEAAEAAGLAYVHIPLVDGRAPGPRQVRRLLDVIEDAPGDVFVHCGGGVGRTTSATAAYQAAAGDDPALWDRLAVGPMSLEQAWFIVSAEPSQPAPEPVAIALLSRYFIDAPRRIVNWVEVAV